MDALRIDRGLRVRIVGFPPSPQYRRRPVSDRAWRVCDEIIECEGDQMERDRRLVEWADAVRAIPRYPCERRGKKQQLFVIGLPRSGTGYTMRRAEELGKLVNIEPLRPPLDGRPVPPIRLKTAGDAAATGTFESSQFQMAMRDMLEELPTEAEVIEAYRRATEKP